MVDQLLSQKEVTKRLSINREFIYQMRKAGLFPEPILLGDRKIAWRESVINEWLARRETDSGATTLEQVTT